MELAVVLVIIGLLVGGVLTGQALVKAAGLRKVGTEFDRYQQSIMAFRDKYILLPGDITNATQVWGSAGGSGLVTDNTCASAASAGFGATGTCNGDGDRGIGGNASWGSVGADNGYERYLIWQHLALAGLIEGKYAPMGSGISYGHKAGWNIPASTSFMNAGWAIIRANDATALAAGAGFTNYGGLAPGLAGRHALVFGNTADSGLGYWRSPLEVLFPEDAKNIDDKYDDGKPFTGRVTVMPTAPLNNSVQCTSPASTVSDASLYRASGAQVIACMLFWTLSL